MVPEDVIYDDDRARRQPRRRLHRHHAVARRAGHRLLDLVRLLRLRLPPHHLASASSPAPSPSTARSASRVEEAHADVMIGHDTGCITTLDKNQWIGKAGDKAYRRCRCWPTASSRRWRCGAHPYKIVQSHWHASLDRDADGEARHRLAGEEGRVRGLSRRRSKQASIETLYDPRRMITSGPGYQADRSNTMSKPILIVGGGPAGLSAAHALARVGQPSVLVEKADRLGGAPILSGYAKLVPSGEWAKDAIGGMVERVIKDPLVDVHTRRHGVDAFAGEPGRILGAGLRRPQRRGRAPRSSRPASRTSTPSTSPNGVSAPSRTWSPPRRSSR